MAKKALITGVTGQDGAYLSEFLLNQGYEVHGIKRRSSLFNTDRVDHLFDGHHDKSKHNFHLHFGDMTDSMNLTSLIADIEPDEIYNLAAQSHVHVSFETPEYTANADAIGTLRILEAVKFLKLTKKTRIYQASTSELYGKVQAIPQNEQTPFYPRSPYAVAKMYAYWITVNYREAYNIFACNGILFNHESPIRGETFVTRKITRAVAKIVLNLQDILYLGNLDAKRDWGHAKDYVKMMHLILQHEKADDWVIATGQTTMVRDFVKLAFEFCGIELEFKGKGLEEQGIISSLNSKRLDELGLDFSHLKTGQIVLKIDPRYFRPTEVDLLLGDPSKAERELGWKREFSLQNLVDDMMKSDLKLMQKDVYLKEGGFKIMRYYE